MSDIVVDGQTIAYDRIDAVPPWRPPEAAIVFIHGVGADRDIWCDWLPHLVAHFPLIRLDLPGHGQSAPWNPVQPLEFGFYARLVEKVAEREQVPTLILIGESMGGTIALYTASVFPGLVRAIVTCSTAHRGGMLRHVDAWRDLIRLEGQNVWSRDMLEKRFTPDAIPTEVRAWFHNVQSRADAGTILDMAELLVGSDLSEHARTVDVPVLLLQPDHSPFIPNEIPVELEGLLADGCLSVIADARHGIASSHADRCARQAAVFLHQQHLMAEPP